MKMKFIGTIIFAGMLFFTLNAYAAEEKEAKDEQKAEKPSVITVRQALTQAADLKDMRVMIVGTFMGFNGSCDSGMPATRLDIMLQDKQGFCIWASGPLPAGFDPINKTGLGEQIVLSGYVVDPDDKPPYFQIPETKTAKNKTQPSSFFIFSRAKDDRLPVITLEKALQTPDKYAGKLMALKGMYLSDSTACGTPKPVIDGEEAPSLWTMKSRDERCLWILGPMPEEAAAKADNNTPITIKGKMKKRNNELLFEISPEETQEPGKDDSAEKKKVKIEINGQE